MIVFRSVMSQPLKAQQLNPEGFRTYILALAGFSFTGLLALALIDRTAQHNLALAILYLVISFLAFIACLNWQSYKQLRWEHEAAGILLDCAVLSMLLAVLSIVLTSEFPISLRYVIAIVGAAIWMIDHAARFAIDVKYLREVKRAIS